jgi:translation initiation factor 4G
MRPISPNFNIAADPRLLIPVSQSGSSTDTHNNRVSLEQDPTGSQTHPTVTSVAGNLHNEQHLKVQVDRQQPNEPDHDVVNSLKQQLVATSLARDSLRIKNTQLSKSSVSKQQKHENEIKDLKNSNDELISKLNESQHHNEILEHQHAQMERTLHLKISELEDSCLRQKILGQKFVSASLARDSLMRVKNNQLIKSHARKQQEHHKKLDDLNRSHHELVAELNQSKLENKLLGQKQAQMEINSHVKISELEENCLRLTKEKEDLAVKLIQAESDVKSLSSSFENQRETVSNLENRILDLQSKKPTVPNASSQGTQTDTSHITVLPYSLPKTYDRAFLMQRKSFGNKKPQCLLSEIVRKGTIGINSSTITEPPPPPKRQIKLFDMKPSERVVDTSNVWKPRRATPAAATVTSATDVVLKTVRGILNKMTPASHERFLAKIVALEINNEESLSGVIKLFFEKALDEPIYAATYAQMCQALATKQVASSTDPTEIVTFRKLLLSRCQKVFQKDSDSLVDVEKKKEEVKNADTKEKKKLLETELYDLVKRNRRITLGNIKFIGELYKVGNISENVMHSCIRRLLQAPDEEATESLCRLLTTIGKGLENQKNIDIMNSYFHAMETITKQNNISNRIRFMVQDVCDLRKRNWIHRNEPCSPNTNTVENRKSKSADEPVASTLQTTKLATKEFGCESKKLPSKILTTEQGTCDDVTCGFQSDKETTRLLTKQQQFRPYNIPDRIDQTKQPVPAAGSAKQQVQFASIDARYQNKPMNGYTVTSGDGLDSIIKSESLPSSTQLRRSAASELKNKQTTQTNSPPTEVTKMTKTGQSDSTKNSPTGLVIAGKQVKQLTEKPESSTASSPDFVILSSVTKEVNYDEIVVTGIQNSDCGRVIGRAGSNIKRLQEEYGVKLSFFEDTLYIFDGDAEGRRAACSDVIDNLPVTIECRNLVLTKKVYSTTYIKQLNFQNSVRISRPSPENKFLTISGTLEKCRQVYQKLLQAGNQ